MRTRKFCRKDLQMSGPAQMDLEFSDLLLGQSDAFAACRDMAKEVAENLSDPAARLQQSQVFCGCVLNSYWQEISGQHRCPLEIRTPPVPLELPDAAIFSLARIAGITAAAFPVLHAGYLIRSIYSAMLPGWECQFLAESITDLDGNRSARK